jgi:hypothetical protein
MTTEHNNPSDIDLTPYTGAVRFGAQHGIVLASQLAVAAPPDITPGEQRALDLMGKKAKRVQKVLVARGKAAPGGLRPVLSALDAAYGGIYARLTSAAKLPAGFGDIAARAAAVLDAVLADGLGFLVNDAETKYAESERRLQVIEEKGLAAEIDRAAGAGFLDALKGAHAALAEALGMGATPVHFARTELLDAVTELAQSVGDYGLQVAAQVDRYDAASVARFRAAMMPIDRFRADRAASAGEHEDGEAVAEPGTTAAAAAAATVVTAGHPALEPGPFVDAA